MLECFGVEDYLIDSLDYVYIFLDDFSETEIPMIKYDNVGVIGFIALPNGHIFIHTFPEKGYFTCDYLTSDECDIDKICERINKHFEPKEITKQIVERKLF